MFKKIIIFLVTISVVVVFSGCRGSIYDNVGGSDSGTNQIKDERVDAEELVGSAHYRGPQDARVTIVEFADFQCPACASVHPTVKKLLEKYPVEVRLVYRHFPLSYHQNAKPAAYAFEAAAKQGKPWEMYDLLYENSSGLSDDLYLESAQKLNLDLEQFKKDMGAEEIKKTVEDDYALGQKINLGGTPTFYLNGAEFQGSNTVDGFSKEIDKILSQ